MHPNIKLYFGGIPERKVFPIGEGDGINNESDAQGDDIAHTLQAGGDKHRGSYIKQLIGGSMGERVYDTDGIAVSQRAEGGGHGAKTGLYQVYDDYNHKMRTDGNTGSVRQTFGNEAPGNGNKLLKNSRIRRLTPLECERLMGLPDNWTKYGVDKEISDSQRYKLCGNGVVVNVVEEIIKRL